LLTDSEKNRYNRHLILDKIGVEGQEKLKASRVLVIGAGGLGCPVLLYLTAAGVGNIGIIDFDTVDETNLQRQVLFTIEDIGINKALAAKKRLSALNNYVNFKTYPEKLTTKNALTIFSAYDIIVDGTDNFSTRYLVNDACVITNKPLVYGAIYKFEGQVTVFNYKNGPSYRCLFPTPPQQGSVPNCSEVGVLGVLPGLIGTQQANEVLKIILEIGSVLSGKMQIYNALEASFYVLKIQRVEQEFEKILANATAFEQFDYDFFCGIEKQTTKQKEITAQELKILLTNEDIQIIDVRAPWEQPKIEVLNAINIPLQDIPTQLEKINRSKKTVVFCQHGVRSLTCIAFLEAHGFDNLINLKDGIVTWDK